MVQVELEACTYTMSAALCLSLMLSCIRALLRITYALKHKQSAVGVRSASGSWLYIHLTLTMSSVDVCVLSRRTAVISHFHGFGPWALIQPLSFVRCSSSHLLDQPPPPPPPPTCPAHLSTFNRRTRRPRWLRPSQHTHHSS